MCRCSFPVPCIETTSSSRGLTSFARTLSGNGACQPNTCSPETWGSTGLRVRLCVGLRQAVFGTLARHAVLTCCFVSGWCAVNLQMGHISHWSGRWRSWHFTRNRPGSWTNDKPQTEVAHCHRLTAHTPPALSKRMVGLEQIQIRTTTLDPSSP